MDSLVISSVNSIVTSIQASLHSAVLQASPSQSDFLTAAAATLQNAFKDSAIVSCKGDQIRVEWGSVEAEMANACGCLMRSYFSRYQRKPDQDLSNISDPGDFGCLMLERTFTAARSRASLKADETDVVVKSTSLPSFASEEVGAHIRSVIEGGAERALASWLLKPPQNPSTPFRFNNKLTLGQGVDWETIKCLFPFFWSIEWQPLQQSDARQGQAFLTLTDGHGVFLSICIRSIPLVKRKKTGGISGLVGRLGIRVLSELRSQGGRGGKGKSSTGSSEEAAMQRRRQKRWSVARAALDYARSSTREQKLPSGSLLFSAILTSEMEGVQVTSRDKEGKAREEALMLALLGCGGLAWPLAATKSDNTEIKNSSSGEKKSRNRGKHPKRAQVVFSSTLLLKWFWGGAGSNRLMAIGSALIISGAALCIIYQTSRLRRG